LSPDYVLKYVGKACLLKIPTAFFAQLECASQSLRNTVLKLTEPYKTTIRAFLWHLFVKKPRNHPNFYRQYRWPTKNPLS